MNGKNRQTEAVAIEFDDTAAKCSIGDAAVKRLVFMPKDRVSAPKIREGVFKLCKRIEL
jgi:hypothetical protein